MGSAPKAGGEEEVGRGKEQGQERRKQTKAGSRAISLFGGLVSQKTFLRRRLYRGLGDSAEA